MSFPQNSTEMDDMKLLFYLVQTDLKGRLTAGKTSIIAQGNEIGLENLAFCPHFGGSSIQTPQFLGGELIWALIFLRRARASLGIHFFLEIFMKFRFKSAIFYCGVALIELWSRDEIPITNTPEGRKRPAAPL